MSDVQGAEDTASGGLVNDMPGIGNAPASPRMVPSALGGLAQFAQQALGIGRPASLAPGPGRSPFQFPGQSQIPVPPGGGAGDRWQGTTASMVLPKGSPQPEGKFTPYIGTLPTNDHTKWGVPEEYPNLPQSHEVPGLYSKLGQIFGQQGGATGPWGLLLAGHANAYIKGVMQGQQYRANLEKERMVLAGMKLAEIEEKRHRMIGEIVAKYVTEAGSRDPAKLDKFAIRGVTMNDALHQYAIENDDPDIRQMTEDGVGLGKIWDYQKLRDANWKDLQKTNQKAQEQSEDDKMWDDNQQGGGSQSSSTAPQPTPESPAPDQPGGAPAPEMTASTEPPLNPDAPSPDASNVEGMNFSLTPDDQKPADQPSTAGLSPQDEASLREARGYELDTKMAPMHRQKALVEGARIKGQVENIIDTKKGDDVMSAVRAIPKYGPAIASELQGVSNYSQAIGGQTGISTGGRQGEWYGPDGIISRLAQAYNPKWNQAYYHDRDVFRNSVQNRTIMYRTGDLSAAAQLIMNDRKAIEEHEHIDPTKINWQGIIRRATTDFRYQALQADILSYMDAYNTITSGGRHTETGATKQANLLPSYATLAAITNVVKHHMVTINGARQALHDQWEAIGGKPDDMPYDNPKTNKVITDIMLADPISGAYPGEIKEHNGVRLRYTGKNQIDPNARENWESP